VVKIFDAQSRRLFHSLRVLIIIPAILRASEVALKLLFYCKTIYSLTSLYEAREMTLTDVQRSEVKS